MKYVFHKEIITFFAGLHGFAIVVLFAIFANFLFIKDVFLYSSASMRSFFELAPWLLMVFVPLVTMRMFAQERHSGTIEILQTLPLHARDIICGKLLAAITVCASGVLLTCIVPIVLWIMIGNTFAIETVVTGYIGLTAYIALFASVGIFVSLQTTNQALAFIITALAMFMMNSLGTDFFASVIPSVLQQYVFIFSPTYHIGTFAKGLIDVRSIWYFASLTIVFIWLAVLDFHKK